MEKKGIEVLAAIFKDFKYGKERSLKQLEVQLFDILKQIDN